VYKRNKKVNQGMTSLVKVSIVHQEWILNKIFINNIRIKQVKISILKTLDKIY
jgi:hypothetical protein